MEAEFPRVGLDHGDLRPKGGKHHKWNVDHLLDQSCVTLTAAYLIRWPRRVECGVGRLLMGDPATIAFEPRLGANDLPGSTHLLRVEADEAWWRELPQKLRRFMLTIQPESERGPSVRPAARSSR